MAHLVAVVTFDIFALVLALFGGEGFILGLVLPFA
jgi:hypothetical protein